MIRSQLAYDFIHDHRIKLLICGDCSVGKTSVLTRFVSDKFNVIQSRTVGELLVLSTCNNVCYIFKPFIVCCGIDSIPQGICYT